MQQADWIEAGVTVSHHDRPQHQLTLRSQRKFRAFMWADRQVTNAGAAYWPPNRSVVIRKMPAHWTGLSTGLHQRRRL